MEAKVYEVSNVVQGPFDGAKMVVWKDVNSSVYRLVVSNDQNSDNNGSYNMLVLENSGNGPFELAKFNVNDTLTYYKPGTENGIIYVGENGVAVVEE